MKKKKTKKIKSHYFLCINRNDTQVSVEVTQCIIQLEALNKTKKSQILSFYE